MDTTQCLVTDENTSRKSKLLFPVCKVLASPQDTPWCHLDSCFLVVAAVISSVTCEMIAERGSSSHSFRKKLRATCPPAVCFGKIHSCYSGLQSLVRGCVCWPGQQLSVVRIQPSQPLSSKWTGIHVPMSAGGSSPFWRKGRILSKSQDSVEAVINLCRKSFAFTFRHCEKSMFSSLKTFRGSSVILVGKLKCHN